MEWHPQTFSSLMCWAAVDRVGRIATKHRPEVADEFRAAAERIQREILDKGYNPSLESFVASYGGSNIDASLLQLPSLGFLPADDPRVAKTIALVRRELALDGWMKRYKGDPMGTTQVAFTMCTFWLVEALNRIGDKGAARTMLEFALQSLSPMGLIAEDYDPAAQRMWGNFPQAYSHVGLIHAAFAASPPWSDVT